MSTLAFLWKDNIIGRNVFSWWTQHLLQWTESKAQGEVEQLSLEVKR